MLTRHRSHLYSTCTTALQHLEEVRQAVTAGKSPSGARLSPLPGPARQRLLDALSATATVLEGMMREFAPDESAAQAEPAGASATIMWVNILLRTVEELLSDLSPARTSRRYGALPQAEAQRLQGEVERAVASVRRAMEISDSVSG
ncbi:MAG: hypothetical protein ACE149_02855 [Armatimonadota bacterium]